MVKICKKCGEEKEFSEFHKSNRIKDGFKNECKICIKLYRENNIDKYKETFWVDRELKEKNELDFHRIKWSLFDGDGSPVEYYSGGMGWSKDGFVDKKNPVPDIEKKFKETIGNNLIYF